MDDAGNAAELYEDMVRRLHYTAHGGREEPMRGLRFAVPVLATIPLAGCELVGDIFKAGIWVGVIFVVLIIAMVGVIATKIRS
jgi:hypothetical protein